ncbi:uncharacterized protein TNCV_1638091 [Trichonephila clavipes]|nr:uncharacterized protein TNCV_1638091 [Trichonephila clavipes]
MGYHPGVFEKKRHRKVRHFFDDFNADEKLQDRERLFELDVFKANVDVITQLKNRFESMNGIYKSFSFLSPKNIWLVTLTAVALGLSPNTGEGMDICKGIVLLWHKGTLNRCRAASPLMRLVEGKERWEAPDHPRVFSLKIGMEPSQIVLPLAWCLKLRLMTGLNY